MQAAGGNYIFYRYAKDRSGKCFDHWNTWWKFIAEKIGLN
jgi:hypothetical protein